MPTFVDILGDASKYPDATEWTLPDGSKTTVGAERAKMKDAFMPKEDFTRGQQKAAAERQQLEQEYNQKLSERRAISVKDYLESKGINATRMTAMGYGEAQPVASNDTDTGRAQNRRVELIVLDR